MGGGGEEIQNKSTSENNVLHKVTSMFMPSIFFSILEARFPEGNGQVNKQSWTP